MDFSKMFQRDIPLDAAADYFARMTKTAEWTDPPDMTGQLEGMFLVPVEQVLAKLRSVITAKLRKMVAYHTYAESLNHPSWRGVKLEFHDHAEDEKNGADYYMKRATVLGGPVLFDAIEPPPPTTNVDTIMMTMARAEQEGIAAQRELRQLVGDENPMKIGIEEQMLCDQHHLDELFQMMTPECRLALEQGGAAAPPAALEMGAPEATPPAEEPPAEAGPEKQADVSRTLHRAGVAVRRGWNRFGELATGIKAKDIAAKAGEHFPDLGAAPSKRFNKLVRLAENEGHKSKVFRRIAGGAVGVTAAGYGAKKLLDGDEKDSDKQAAALFQKAAEGLSPLMAEVMVPATLAGESSTPEPEMAATPTAPPAEPKPKKPKSDPEPAATEGEDKQAAARFVDALQKLANESVQGAPPKVNPKTELVDRVAQEYPGSAGRHIDRHNAFVLSEVIPQLEQMEMDAHEQAAAEYGAALQKARGVKSNAPLIGGALGAMGGGMTGYRMGGNGLAAAGGALAGGALGLGLGSLVNEAQVMGRMSKLPREADLRRDKRNQIFDERGLGRYSTIDGRFHDNIDLPEEWKTAAARFDGAIAKLASDMGTGDPSMVSPSAGQMEPMNYLRAELQGRQMQEQNESAFYREQLGQTQQQTQMLQQQLADMQGQLQSMQSQPDQSQQFMQQAVMAQDEATRQAMEAAKARIGAQQLRQLVLEAVSQDPQQLGEQAFPQQAAIDPMTGQPVQVDPATGQPMAADPMAAQAGAAQDPNAAAGAAPPGPPAGAENAQQTKAAGVSPAMMGAAGGAVLGAGSALLAGQRAPGLRQKVETLEAAQNGSFIQAARLAANKAGLATAELAEKHPVGAAIGGAITGGLMGHGAGPAIEGIGSSLRELAR